MFVHSRDQVLVICMDQFKALTSACGLRRAEHNEEYLLTPLEQDPFGLYSP